MGRSRADLWQHSASSWLASLAYDTHSNQLLCCIVIRPACQSYVTVLLPASQQLSCQVHAQPQNATCVKSKQACHSWLQLMSLPSCFVNVACLCSAGMREVQPLLAISPCWGVCCASGQQDGHCLSPCLDRNAPSEYTWGGCLLLSGWLVPAHSSKGLGKRKHWQVRSLLPPVLPLFRSK